MNLRSLRSLTMESVENIPDIIFKYWRDNKQDKTIPEKRIVLEEPNFCVLFYYFIIFLCKESLYREVTNSKLKVF